MPTILSQIWKERKSFEKQFLQEYNCVLDRKIVAPILRVENVYNFDFIKIFWPTLMLGANISETD